MTTFCIAFYQPNYSTHLQCTRDGGGGAYGKKYMQCKYTKIIFIASENGFEKRLRKERKVHQACMLHSFALSCTFLPCLALYCTVSCTVFHALPCTLCTVLHCLALTSLSFCAFRCVDHLCVHPTVLYCPTLWVNLLALPFTFLHDLQCFKIIHCVLHFLSLCWTVFPNWLHYRLQYMLNILALLCREGFIFLPCNN